MIERTKPISEKFPDLIPDSSARVKRSDTLKKKIGVIIKEHPNKTLSVIRSWLNDDQN